MTPPLRPPLDRLLELAVRRPDLQERILLLFERDEPQRMVRCPDDLLQAVAPHLVGLDHERLVCVWLSNQHQVLGVEVLSVGSDRFTVVDPPFVLRKALLAGASRLAIAHNHPAGDPTPSSPDIDVTRRLCEAAAIVGVPLIDHLIVGGAGFYSMAEHGHLEMRYPPVGSYTT